MSVKRCQNTGCSKVYHERDAGFAGDRCLSCGFPILDPWQDVWSGQPENVAPKRVAPTPNPKPRQPSAAKAAPAGQPAAAPAPMQQVRTKTPPPGAVPEPPVTPPARRPGYRVDVYAKGKGDDKARLVGSHPLDALEVSVGRRRPGEPLPDIDVTDFDEDRYVSAPHLSLLLRDGALLVVDQQSKNGTWLNRQQLPPSVPHPLKAGDELVLGLGVGLKVVVEEPSDAHGTA